MSFTKTYEEAKASYKPMARSEMKQGGKLKPLGKKGKTWASVRGNCKQRFEWAGITTCEARLPGCWLDDGLGFAHCKKRRKLEGDDIWHCALLCNHCHDKWEKLPHEEMHAKIHFLIDRRGGIIAPPDVVEAEKLRGNGCRSPNGRETRLPKS